MASSSFYLKKTKTLGFSSSTRNNHNNFLCSSSRWTRSFSSDIHSRTSSTTPIVPKDAALFPYNETNFPALREAGQFFVDKTEYLEMVGRRINATFVRPPGFGKSLFASMLASYVDIATTDEQYDR